MHSTLLSLATSLGDAATAIASCDLPRLEHAVVAQQQALARITTETESAIRELRNSPQIASDLARSSAVLAAVLRRSRRTTIALASVREISGEPYALESLLRR